LLYTRYGVLKRWAMRRIVAKAGGDTDTSRDYEYTNWDEVVRFARAFAEGLTREDRQRESPVVATH
jgi:menaquinone-dependent protoporphyrinogen oxidase